MTAKSSDFVNEIKQWLKVVLKGENIRELSVNIVGNSEKGDGFMGDIVFVEANGWTNDKVFSKYNLVLKCSKRSQVLREKSHIKKTFMNEIAVYEKILPYFMNFQEEKKLESPFTSVAKCYGCYVEENLEVIVLENLKNLNFELWPKKQPLTRKHVDLVVTEYGKFHGISVALKEQRPNEFQKLVESVEDIFKGASKPEDMDILFGTPIEESYNLLKNELDETTALIWRNFKKQINFVLTGMLENMNCLKVILHGDCWNNNFMFRQPRNENLPHQVVFLDWQVSRYSSPILDLAYFLFTCLSEDDFENLDNILHAYYESLTKQMQKLGVVNAQIYYPREQFLKEWQNYSKYGVLMASLVLKVVCTDKEDVGDIVEVAESGQHFSQTFLNETKDKKSYKGRVKPLIEYAVNHNLI